VAAQRDAVEIRAELESARNRLAVSVDQLTERLAPARLVDEAKADLRQRQAELQAKAMTPTGKAIIGGAGLLLTLMVIRNLRRSRR